MPILAIKVWQYEVFPNAPHHMPNIWIWIFNVKHLSVNMLGHNHMLNPLSFPNQYSNMSKTFWVLTFQSDQKHPGEHMHIGINCKSSNNRSFCTHPIHPIVKIMFCYIHLIKIACHISIDIEKFPNRNIQTSNINCQNHFAFWILSIKTSHGTSQMA